MLLLLDLRRAAAAGQIIQFHQQLLRIVNRIDDQHGMNHQERPEKQTSSGEIKRQGDHDSGEVVGHV